MPLILAACTSSKQQDLLASQAADIAALRQDISRRDGQIAQLEQNLGALRHDLAELQAALAERQKAAEVVVEPAAPPVPEDAQEATPATAQQDGEFAIHLASYGSPAQAAEGWAKLARQHPDLAAGLEPRFTTLNIDDAVYYRLIAGRFDSHDSARQACIEVKTATGYCVVTFFGGEPLP